MGNWRSSLLSQSALFFPVCIYMAAAARALSITEVLEQICAYNDTTTNVQAGLVSRGWSEIALKFVWSSIDDIVPLVSTLSPLKASPDSGMVSRFLI